MATYNFQICTECEVEIDESNEHKHEGKGHKIQWVPMVPVEQTLEAMRSDEVLAEIAKIVESCPVDDVSPRRCAEQIVRYLTSPRVVESEENEENA